MYNYKSVQAFIEKVNEEAEKAAQAVYDKYNDELFKRVLAQVKKGDTVCVANGAAIIYRKHEEGREVGENLAAELSSIQYHQVCAGFSFPYTTTKGD